MRGVIAGKVSAVRLRFSSDDVEGPVGGVDVIAGAVQMLGCEKSGLVDKCLHSCKRTISQPTQGGYTLHRQHEEASPR